MSKPGPKVVVAAGPTAAGKTSIGLELAEWLGGEIVSADSIQVYRGMDVGSAKPTALERARIPHHMIDICDPDEEFSGGDYVREARRCIAAIVERGNIPVVVGGTGLYIRLLLKGVIDSPRADPELRARLLMEEQEGGQGTLFARLSAIDPKAALAAGPHNLVRIVRALEFFQSAGAAVSESREKHLFGDRPYDYLFLCLAPDREVLYERIDKRVDSMIKGGLCKEVSDLVARGYSLELKPMRSLGYRHVGMALAGLLDLDAAIQLMKRDTRRYAKRQITWFRSEPEAVWFDPGNKEGIRLVVVNFLGR
jgi:tRNA dimethylallyltransferase